MRWLALLLMVLPSRQQQQINPLGQGINIGAVPGQQTPAQSTLFTGTGANPFYGGKDPQSWNVPSTSMFVRVLPTLERQPESNCQHWLRDY